MRSSSNNQWNRLAYEKAAQAPLFLKVSLKKVSPDKQTLRSNYAGDEN